MKRFYLIALLMLFSFPAVFGQLQFGVKGGIVSSTTNLVETLNDFPNTQEINYDELKVEAMDSKVGFQAGFFGRLSLAALYLQPELMFTSTSSRVKISKLTKEGDLFEDPQIKNQSFKRVDLPIMVGWKFGPARLQAGPVGSIMLSQQSAIEAATDYKEEFNGATWGYQVGVGLDLLNTLTLDAKYEGSLSKMGESVEIGDKPYSIDNRPRQFIVTVGLFF